jgi:NADPH-dependent glutamate synthase beta subunit-like oxidoreductase/formate hydrogenlyase subunit 6/NADH:ubiquinone oxidoreductase subunit I
VAVDERNDLVADRSVSQAPAAASDPAAMVPALLSVSDEYASGVRGFVERWRSLATGLAITGKRAAGKPTTLRYPYEKYAISPRWRGALRLRGILGRDDVSLFGGPSPDYNGLIEQSWSDETLPPCVGNCPANVDARGQNFLMADDRTVEAYELVRSRNIMPGVLGRICHHPCETACRRNYYDEPIAIRPLHRQAFERFQEARTAPLTPLPRTRGKEVAIIGAGPSGLAAALDLMSLGYGVTVYEKEDSAGGALLSGVPAYRLPRDVLKREIDDLVELGMHLRLGLRVGEDVPLDHLVGEYDAVLISVGLQESRILPIPGHDAVGVVGALPFLRAANWKGDAGVVGKRVLVIGGGNVAVDCARCALRVGATEVRLASLESQDEMPAHPWEIEEALDEGVIATCSVGPEEVLVEDDHVVGMRMRECLSVFDEVGRFSPKFGEGLSDFAADVVVFSIGQGAALRDIVAGSDLMLTERGLLPVDGTLMTTDLPSVFACGEVVTGPGSCIGSIATGHEAATSIHRFLDGKSLSEDRVARPVPVYDRYEPATLDGVESDRRRVVMPMARPSERRADFRPVELGLTRVEALQEAARCLRCQSGVCVGCTFCARTCPDYCIKVERVDDPANRRVTRYDFDLSKCCFCGLCAEQCPTDALRHTAQYELTFYHRDLMVLERGEMLRDPGGTRATGRDAERSAP